MLTVNDCKVTTLKIANEDDETENDLSLSYVKCVWIDYRDVDNYLKKAILGARQYCVKEPLSTLRKARIQLYMWAFTINFIKHF